MGIKKGIRIGSARDGRVTAFIEDMESTRAEHSGRKALASMPQGTSMALRADVDAQSRSRITIRSLAGTPSSFTPCQTSAVTAP